MPKFQGHGVGVVDNNKKYPVCENLSTVYRNTVDYLIMRIKPKDGNYIYVVVVIIFRIFLGNTVSK